MKKWIEILLHVSVVVLAVIVLRDPNAARKWLWKTLGYSTPNSAPTSAAVAPVKRHTRVAQEQVPEAPVESALPAALTTLE